jgi:hypothetical protein
MFGFTKSVDRPCTVTDASALVQTVSFCAIGSGNLEVRTISMVFDEGVTDAGTFMVNVPVSTPSPRPPTQVRISLSTNTAELAFTADASMGSIATSTVSGLSRFTAPQFYVVKTAELGSPEPAAVSLLYKTYRNVNAGTGFDVVRVLFGLPTGIVAISGATLVCYIRTPDSAWYAATTDTFSLATSEASGIVTATVSPSDKPILDNVLNVESGSNVGITLLCTGFKYDATRFIEQPSYSPPFQPVFVSANSAGMYLLPPAAGFAVRTRTAFISFSFSAASLTETAVDGLRSDLTASANVPSGAGGSSGVTYDGSNSLLTIVLGYDSLTPYMMAPRDPAALPTLHQDILTALSSRAPSAALTGFLVGDRGELKCKAQPTDTAYITCIPAAPNNCGQTVFPSVPVCVVDQTLQASATPCFFFTLPSLDLTAAGCGAWRCRRGTGTEATWDVCAVSDMSCPAGCAAVDVATIWAVGVKECINTATNAVLAAADFCPESVVDPITLSGTCQASSDCGYVCATAASTAAHDDDAAVPYTVAPCDGELPWSGCSGAPCGHGTNTRTVSCVNRLTIGATYQPADTVPAAPFCGAVPAASVPMPTRPCVSTQCGSFRWECANVADATADPDLNGSAVWSTCSDVALSGAACSSPCGPGLRTRAARCSLYSGSNSYVSSYAGFTMAFRVGTAAAQPCSLAAPAPALFEVCRGNACPAAAYKCYAAGASPQTAVDCASDGGFPVCPSGGCSAATPEVTRSAACFRGSLMVPLSECAAFTVPVTAKTCPAQTAACGRHFPLSSVCYTGSGASKVTVTCDAGTPSVRDGVCVNATGATVDATLCDPAGTVTEPCALPACGSTPEYQWVIAAVGTCTSGAAYACRAYAEDTVNCAYRIPPSTAFTTTAPVMCNPLTKPPTVRICATPLPGACAVASHGTCTFSNFVDATGSVTANAAGRCVCSNGYVGPTCALSPAVVIDSAADAAGTVTVRYHFANDAANAFAVSAGTKSVSVFLIPAAGALAGTPVAVAVHRPATATHDGAGVFTVTAARPAGISPGLHTARVQVNAAVQTTTPSFVIGALCQGQCQNGGTCDAATQKCRCVGGWSGATCSVSPCDTAQCNPSGGICAVPVEPTEAAVATCTCAVSTGGGAEVLFSGTRCLTPTGSACSGATACQNGGTRSGFLTTGSTVQCAACVCPAPWTGVLCDTCSLKCYNGGVPNADCTACTCPQGYVGADCQCRNVVARVLASSTHATTKPWFTAGSTTESVAAAFQVWGASLAVDLLPLLRPASGSVPAAEEPQIASVSLQRFNLSLGYFEVNMTLTNAAACRPNWVVPVDDLSVLEYSDNDADLYPLYQSAARLGVAVSTGAAGDSPSVTSIRSQSGIDLTDSICTSGSSCPAAVGGAGALETVIPAPEPETPRAPPKNTALSSTETIIVAVVCAAAGLILILLLLIAIARGWCCFGRADRKNKISPRHDDFEMTHRGF